MKFQFNHTFTFSAILTLLMMCTQLSAQNIDWVLEPIITDADRIEIEEDIQDEIHLINVQKNEKWGVKDLNNSIVLPIQYDRTSIWTGGLFARGVMNGSSTYYFVDSEGYEVDYETDVKPANDIWNRKKFNKAENNKRYVRERYNGFEYEVVGDEKTLISKLTGKVVIPNVNYNKLYKINEEMIGYTAGNRVQIFSNNGELLKAWDPKSDFRIIVNDRIIIRQDKLYGLYDFQMNMVIPHEYSNMHHIGGEFFGAKNDDSSLLLDQNGSIIQSDLKGIHTLKNKKHFYTVSNSGVNTLYSIEDKSSHTVEGSLRNTYIGNLIKVTNKDTLSGMIDMKTLEIVIPLKYKYLDVTGGVILADNIPFKVKKRKNGYRIKRGNIYGFKDVYNKEGRLILSDSIYQPKRIGKNTFSLQVQKGKTNSLYDTEGNILRSISEGEKISLAKGNYVSIAPAGDPKFKKFLDWEQYQAEQTEYQAILGEYKNKDKSRIYYHVRQNEKEGLIDAEGNVIIPIVLDKIDLKEHRRYLPALYKGKWGLINNPIKA